MLQLKTQRIHIPQAELFLYVESMLIRRVIYLLRYVFRDRDAK